MRLIDADAIKLPEGFFEKVDNVPKFYDWLNSLPTIEAEPEHDEWCTDCKEYDQKRHCCPRFRRVIRETVEDVRQNAQTEVVRCKDCKHYNAGFECLIEGYGIERNPNWFCADGEWREETKYGKE